MLNGLDPVIIFQFSALKGTKLDLVAKIPVLAKVASFVDQPPIPFYLSETLTGIVVKSKDKSVSIQTDVETKTDGTTPDTTQKGTESTVSINLEAKKSNVPMTLLSALIDQLFEKVSSDEYSISFFHGATTVFQGKLVSYVVNEESNSELMDIKIELTRGSAKTVKKVDNSLPSVSASPPSVVPL